MALFYNFYVRHCILFATAGTHEMHVSASVFSNMGVNDQTEQEIVEHLDVLFDRRSVIST